MNSEKSCVWGQYPGNSMHTFLQDMEYAMAVVATAARLWTIVSDAVTCS